MEIVVDTSVIVAVIANEPERDALVEVTKGADLIAPPSVYWEVGNAFSAMLKQKRADLASVQRAVNIFEQIPIRFVDVELAECLRIVADLNIYAYDAYLVRCALKYASPLISLDSNLVQCARRLKVQVIEVPR